MLNFITEYFVQICQNLAEIQSSDYSNADENSVSVYKNQLLTQQKSFVHFTEMREIKVHHGLATKSNIPIALKHHPGN